MKKFLFASAAGLIAALMATNGAYAQQNSVTTEFSEPQKSVAATEKAIPANDHVVNISALSPKALKEFNRAYKNVTGESWDKNREGFTAKFNLDGVMNVVYFGNNGKWAGSLKGYSEEKMPAEIRKMVKSEYFDYKITYVQEAQTIDSDGKATYIIHLEDKNSIRQLRVFDGQMEIWREFKKQS